DVVRACGQVGGRAARGAGEDREGVADEGYAVCAVAVRVTVGDGQAFAAAVDGHAGRVARCDAQGFAGLRGGLFGAVQGGAHEVGVDYSPAASEQGADALDGGLRLLQLGAGGVGVPLLGVHVLPEEGGFVGAEDDAAGGAVEDDAEAGAAGGALRVVVGVEGCEACGLLGGGEGVPGGPVLVAEGGRRVLLGGAGLHVGACGPLLDQAGGLVHLL